MTKQELFNLADSNKKSNVTLSLKDLKTKMQEDDYRVKLIYNSNALRGSLLSIDETRDLLFGNRTDNNSEEYTYLMGQLDALNFILEYLKREDNLISEEMIKKIHYYLTVKSNKAGAGAYRLINSTMEALEYNPSQPEDIPRLMEHFINQMETSQKMFHPIEFAAMCYKRFLNIYPFRNGNEFVALLLLNYILIKAGYGILTISPKWKEEYDRVFRAAHSNKIDALDKYIIFMASNIYERE